MAVTNLMFNGVHYDSDEEVFVAMWLQELKDAGFLDEFGRCKTPFSLTNGLSIPYTKKTVLKTKTKTEQKLLTLLRPSEYKYDFYIMFNLMAYEKGILGEVADSFCEYDYEDIKNIVIWDSGTYTYLEVKPSFDQNNMERLFVNNQKFLWDKRKIFVNLVEPVELFKKTFIPSLAAPYFKYKKAPTGKNKGKKGVGDWKFDFIPKTLNEFLNGK